MIDVRRRDNETWMSRLGNWWEERKEAELSVAAFERQLASIKEQCALLDVEIEQRRAVVMNLRRGASRNSLNFVLSFTPR